ncbi:MAG: tRNA uridine-5-carboxymethylaminomethyl(34) synthesis GTPase MnmE [Deltaproteobacteria bacterium]|nr:tRNA uridine-5-carboxymethylaminomethyl(34) synthesis GTPase MnmE [Deltaproteobacteria bacterium]
MIKKPQPLFIDDTIAAVATAVGEGGIGVLRVSGSSAFKVAGRIFELNQSDRSYIREEEAEVNDLIESLEPRRLYFGRIHNGGETIDYGFIVSFKDPLSYTGEDVVELQTHGGVVVMQAVLEAAMKAGARLAEPGEFTKRAYLNGKIDLTQAEAVGELIRAKTTLSMRSARVRLEGALSVRVDSIRDDIFALTAGLEAELDFSEDEVNDIVSNDGEEDNFTETLLDISAKLKELISTYNEGRNLRDGLTTAILGKPNAGKSSLLNLLLREERAIVTSEPGTTRDTIEELISIRELPIRLIDTAGLRESSDKIETAGIERARKSFKRASLVLFVVDASKEDIEEDIRELEGLINESEESEDNNDKVILVILNKADLTDKDKLDAIAKGMGTRPYCSGTIPVSALTGTGLDSLEDALFEAGTTTADAGSEGLCVATLRQLTALNSAKDAVERVLKAKNEGLTKDALAVDLHLALNNLGEVTGEVISDDAILDKIFHEFCIGK